jgi:hypothetical protein
LFARKLCVRLKQHDNTLLIKTSRHLAEKWTYEMNMGEKFIVQCHSMWEGCCAFSSFFLAFFTKKNNKISFFINFVKISYKNVMKFLRWLSVGLLQNDSCLITPGNWVIKTFDLLNNKKRNFRHWMLILSQHDKKAMKM